MGNISARLKARKAKGQCLKCLFPSVKGKTLCPSHLAYMRKFMRARTLKKRREWVREFLNHFTEHHWMNDVTYEDFGVALLEAWTLKVNKWRESKDHGFDL